MTTHEVGSPTEYEAALASADPGDTIVLDPDGSPYPRVQETSGKNDITIQSAPSGRALLGGVYANGNGWRVRHVDVYRDTGDPPNRQVWAVRLAGDHHTVEGVKVDYTHGHGMQEYRRWRDPEWATLAGNGILLEGNFCKAYDNAMIGVHRGLVFGWKCMSCRAESNVVAGFTESAIRPRGNVHVENNMVVDARMFAKTHSTAISTRLREQGEKGPHLPLRIVRNTIIGSLLHNDPGADSTRAGLSGWAWMRYSLIERNVLLGTGFHGWFLYQVTGSSIQDNWALLDFGVGSVDYPDRKPPDYTMWRYQPDSDGEPNVFEGNIANRIVTDGSNAAGPLVSQAELAANGNREIPVGDYSEFFPHWDKRQQNDMWAFLPADPNMGSDLVEPFLIHGLWPWEINRADKPITAKIPEPTPTLAELVGQMEDLLAEFKRRVG